MKNAVSIEDIKKLKSFDSATISNAIEFFKIRDDTVGYSSMELRCLTPEYPSMVGFAVTVTVDTTTPGPISGRLDKLSELFDVLDKSPKPSVICMKYVGPDRSRSCIAGDIFATAVQKVEAVGLVTDCGIRDLKGIKKRAREFNIFCPGLVASHGLGNFIELGATVSICGLTIKQGDLLHGDENGVVSIPFDFINIKDLIDRAKKVMEEEKKMFDFLDSNSITLQSIKERIAPKKD